MANNTKEKLFSQFPQTPTEVWEQVITADLKGADYDKKLVWQTNEGFNVRPYYRAEDLKNIKYLGTTCGEFPYVRGTHCHNHWFIHETIRVDEAGKIKEANKLALHAVEAGAESIGFSLGFEVTAQNVADLTEGIDLNAAELVFSCAGAKSAVEPMLALADAKKADPEKFRASFVIDPVMNKLSLKGAFSCSEDGSKCFAEIAKVVKSTARYPRVKVVGIGGHLFHNSGSTITQELGFTLAVGHEYLTKLIEAGLTVDEAVGAIRFSMAVSSNYFMEIAKFRAGRMLWANIVKAYEPKKECSQKMFAHAVTSKWNMTAYDPYVNMLRGTTEAMSASIAGVHSLEVLPFNAAYESPTEFSSRIARNVQLLLKNESHFDSVVDPSGGSYYIENLTQSIATEAWKIFLETEEKGGYIKAFRSGFVTETIEASAAAKDKAIATRRTILLGTNQYPNFTEVAAKEISESDVTRGGKCACSCQTSDEKAFTLKPYRGAMAFEEMRLRTDRSGKAPRAFMLTCGTLSMARARSQFASNFFACAGIRVEDNTFFKSVEEGVKAALAAKAEIVVICAADDDYAELAPKAYELLGGKAIFVVAGAPASQAELEAKGINHFISVRSNVLETLKQYQTELGI